MDVDDPAAETPGEGLLQDRVIAGADDEVHPVILQQLGHGPIARFPVGIF